MYDDYKKAIIEQLDELLVSDLRSSPNYSVMIMVRDGLIAKGLKSEVAEHIAAKAQIQIHPDIWIDKTFINTVVDKYTSIVVNIVNHADTILKHGDNVYHLVEGMNLLLVP
jgi:deoxyxylulose-5-phosphate synthase